MSSLVDARRSLREQLPELTAEEFEALVDEVDDECIRRGWPCAPFEEPVA